MKYRTLMLARFRLTLLGEKLTAIFLSSLHDVESVALRAREIIK